MLIEVKKAGLKPAFFYAIFGFYNNKIRHQTALVAVIGDHRFAQFPNQRQS